MRKQWPAPPTSASRGEFIFFVVDVIDSSRLFAEKLYDPELGQHHEALNRVYEHVCRSFRLTKKSQYIWNWAGDGGVLAFPAGVLGTTDNVLACAQEIAKLDSGECSTKCGPFNLQVRMVLHRGEAYYHPTKSLCRSGALNFAAKVHLPGTRTSLTVTDEFYSNLRPENQREFRPIVLRDKSATRIYSHAPLMIEGYTNEIDKLTRSDHSLTPSDPSQAAHLAYRLGVLQFSEGKREAATDAFQKAIDCLDSIEKRYRHRYFYRSLREFYLLWHRLAAEAPNDLLKHARRHDQLAMLRSSEFRDFRTADASWQLLLEMELIVEQLDVLAGNPVDDPIGLTSLEICLLLERVGYPRKWFGPAVHNRLERIKADMAADEEHTVDEGCSLCTGVAASCLVLNHDSESADTLMGWLRSLKDSNYCRRRTDRFADVAKDKHAFNYAAMVLQAFIDNGGDSSDPHVTRLLELFLAEPAAKPDELPPRWTQYLTTTVYDFSTYMFPALARYRLSGGEFDAGSDKVREEVVKGALSALAERLRRDASAAKLQDETGRLYSARENVGSFALGQLIEDFSDADDIIKYNLERLAKYAHNKASPTIRARTIDSNLDRIRKMLEGWLLQIEAALYRRDDRRWSIPAYATETLGISAERAADDFQDSR
jgi:hypothetical protein